MFGAHSITAIGDALRHLTRLFPGAFALAGGISLVERRGQGDRVSRKRPVELSTILESIPEAALIVDTGRRIVDANSAAGQMFGSPVRDLVGRSWDDLGRIFSSGNHNGNKPAPVLDRALRGTAVRQERRLLRGRTQELELIVSATPMRNERGEIMGALMIARDVTELTGLQRRIGDVERHLAIGQMAAALAHDFNNILAAIGQAAFILESAPSLSDAERHTYLDIIQNAVRRGSEVIAGVREYIRTGSGALGPLDIRRILQESVELTRPLWIKGRVSVRTDLPQVPQVLGNAADLRRVFTNLIINAIEAMPGGGQIVLDCRRDNDNIVIGVRDTGPGISAENRAKIFYPYFTTKQAGTGLGLSGAQRILLAQGGNITFRTEEGRGTTFLITLPVFKRDTETRPGPTQRDNPAA